MTARRVASSVALSLVALASSAHAALEDSVVAIYVRTASGEVQQGTGFLVPSGGLVLTCYHVVRGAQTIDIHWRTNSTENVRVEAYSPKHDLALLRARGLPADLGPLELASSPTGPANESLQIIGWPRNMPRFHLPASRSTSELRSSLTLRETDNSRIFNEKIDVIPITAPIYSGTSGAPVLSRGRVVGVLSGSFEDGADGIAWAIPITYYTRGMTRVAKAPSAVAWPSFTLMKSNWRSSTAHYEHRRETEAVRSSARQLDRIADFELETDQLSAIAVRFQRRSREARGVIDASLGEGKTRPSLPTKVRPAVAAFGDLSDSFGRINDDFSDVLARSSDLSGSRLESSAGRRHLERGREEWSSAAAAFRETNSLWQTAFLRWSTAQRHFEVASSGAVDAPAWWTYLRSLKSALLSIERFTASLGSEAFLTPLTEAQSSLAKAIEYSKYSEKTGPMASAEAPRPAPPPPIPSRAPAANRCARQFSALDDLVERIEGYDYRGWTESDFEATLAANQRVIEQAERLGPQCDGLDWHLVRPRLKNNEVRFRLLDLQFKRLNE